MELTKEHFDTHIAGIRNEIITVADRVAAMSAAVTELSGNVTTMSGTVTDLSSTVATMSDTLDRLAGSTKRGFDDLTKRLDVRDQVEELSILSGHIFCALCAAPIIRFLKRQGFVQPPKTISV